MDMSTWFSKVEIETKLLCKQMAGVNLGGIAQSNIGINWGMDG